MQSNKERLEILWERELKDNKLIKELESILHSNGLSMNDLKKLRSLESENKYRDNKKSFIAAGGTKVSLALNEATEITKKDIEVVENTSTIKKIRNNFSNTLKALSDSSKQTAEVNRFANKWKTLMVHLGLYNMVYKTFTFTELRFEKYGVIATVSAVTGLTLKKLEDKLDEIESEFDCNVAFIKKATSKKECTIKFIKPNLEYNKIPFTPYKVKPYELYFGVDETGAPIIADRNKNPHTLIAGQTGKGKNGALDHALISSIVHCNPSELQLILLEGYKSDLAKYSLAPHTQAYVTDFEDMQKVMTYVENEMRRRIKLFMPMLLAIKGDNLRDFHAYTNKHKSLPYILVVVDEFLGLMPAGNDDKKSPTEKAKAYIRHVLQAMAQIGRSVGIHYIISHQKPEKELMPTFLKNMTSTRVCFGFSDSVCSEIVLGTKAAHQLPERRAIFLSDNGEESIFYTTDLRQTSLDYIFKNRIKRYRTDTIQAKLLGENSLYNILGHDAIAQIDPSYAQNQFLKKYDTELKKRDNPDNPKTSEERNELQNKGIISDEINYDQLFG